jgi:hypothetical protein
MHDSPAAAGRSPVHERLAANLAGVRERIVAAARAAGRSTEPAHLPRVLAVSKSVGPDVARALVEIGQSDLGENRLQVLEEKRRAFATQPPRAADGRALPLSWHFVGHLQRNKVKDVVAVCDVVHSVDSARLLAALGEAAAAAQRRIEVFLQVKQWPEENKGGFAPTEVAAALDALERAPFLAPVGFMTMAPLTDEAAQSAAAREVFEGLAALARVHAGRGFVHGAPQLSMGMSDDLEAAVAAGTHWLRIGRALFEGLPQRTIE